MNKRYIKCKACGQWSAYFIFDEAYLGSEPKWCCCIDDPIYDGIQSSTEANLKDLKFHFPASLIDSFYYEE